jgi:hypothetical protein
MKLLEADPTAAPAAPAAPAEGDGVPAPDPVARTCRACSAPMDPAQDWCLECGTAAPGRLGSRPGWRAASTIAGLTLLLVLGAVAASYAALTSEPAQVAAQAAAPSAVPVQPVTPVVPVEPVPTTTTPTDELPEVDAPSSGAGDIPPPTDFGDVGDDTTSGVDSTPITPVTPIDPGTGSDSGTGFGTGSGSSGGTTDTETETDADTDTDTDTGSDTTAIELDAKAGTVYDPYANAVEKNDPARALDGNSSTSFTARAADGADTLGFGYAIALDDPSEVREIVLRTKTAGFRVEVYGARTRTVPPDVLDDRWIHIRDRADVDATVGGSPPDGNTNGDGEERIELGDKVAGKRLRHVLLWFTLAPENGPTVQLTEVELRT